MVKPAQTGLPPGAPGDLAVGATVLVEKIAGAAAERGDDLASVAGIARRVNEKARSYGVALSSCTPPASVASLTVPLADGVGAAAPSVYALVSPPQ